MQLSKELEEHQLGVAFIDYQQFSAAIIDRDPDHVKSTISEVFKSANRAGCVLAAHHTGSHYFLVIICPKWEIVWYIDSLRPLGDDGITLGQRDFTSIKAVIDRYIFELPHLQSSHLEHVTYLICS